MKGSGGFKEAIWVVLGLGLILTTSCAGAKRGREKLEFCVYDMFGREVRSQDYKGVPVFLEFGACW